MHGDRAVISALKECFPMMEVGFVCTKYLKTFSDVLFLLFWFVCF